jgi:hypothetical protein
VGTTIRTVKQQQAANESPQRNSRQKTNTDSIGEYVDFEEIK